MIKKIVASLLAALCVLSLALVPALAESQEAEPEAQSSDLPIVADLELRFGWGGKTYILHMYDNDTAVALVRALGSNDMNLPIYNYDNFEGWEFMTYYDINARDIPSNPETITSVKAGEVYYSDPRRVILIYRDAELTGEYTRVGYVDIDDEFSDTVDQNPVLDGWGNKIIAVRRAPD